MEIRSLKSTPLKEIIQCFTAAFSDYFVPVSDDLEYWQNRFKCARVDYGLSYGAYENGKMIGFIINGIDYHNGRKTAFNTGTGVVSAFRGNKIVDKIYDVALQKFESKGISRCSLEVIQANHKAIRVYERIGFDIKRELLCFKGEIKVTDDIVRFQEVSFQEISKRLNILSKYYSWDFQDQAIKLGKSVFRCFVVISGTTKIGFFVINLKIGQLAQFEIFDETRTENWQLLFNGIAMLTSSIKIINIDSKRNDLIWFLSRSGLDNYINQYEMEMIF